MATPQPKITMKPTPTPKKMVTASKPTDSAVSKAEAMFSDMIRKGTPIAKARQQVSKKTGIWPNGETN